MRRNDACVQETVEFANGGSRPVLVSRIASRETVRDLCGDLVASVWTAPESFEVPGRATARVRVRVEPARPGRVRRALWFRAENRDGGDVAHACVYVRGTVDRRPEVRVRPAAVVTPDEVACAGMPAAVSYGVEFRTSAPRGPLRVRGTRYEFDDRFALRLQSGSVVVTRENGIAGPLELRAPIGTEVRSAF